MVISTSHDGLGFRNVPIGLVHALFRLIDRQRFKILHWKLFAGKVPLTRRAFQRLRRM